MAEGRRPRGCYCRPGPHPERRRSQGIPPGFCALCDVCGAPGHACHYPGALPYTGGWCDEHYAILYDRLAAAEDPAQECGLRDTDRQYFRVPGRRRWLFWRGDAVLMEFRSQCLARYAVVSPSGRTRCRQGRWDHPLGMWLLPLELRRHPDWQPASAEEFERAWAAG